MNSGNGHPHLHVNDLENSHRDGIMGAAVKSAAISMQANGVCPGQLIMLSGGSLADLVLGTNIANGSHGQDMLRVIRALRDVARKMELDLPNRN